MEHYIKLMRPPNRSKNQFELHCSLLSKAHNPIKQCWDNSQQKYWTVSCEMKRQHKDKDCRYDALMIRMNRDTVFDGCQPQDFKAGEEVVIRGTMSIYNDSEFYYGNYIKKEN